MGDVENMHVKASMSQNQSNNVVKSQVMMS